MKLLIALVMLVLPASAQADVIVAARTIRAQTILSAQDLVIKQGDSVDAVLPEDLIGQETRVSLYAGRPIRISDVGPPAVVDRNQIVPLIYDRNGLRIATEGRSLSRAGPGEYIRVMNMSSRTTVSGRVMPDGRVLVSQ